MSRSRIRILPSSIPQNDSFCFVSLASEVSSAVAEKYGLTHLSLNEVMVPKSQGSISRFNANGKYLLLKNLPKESRYINTIRWEWEQWKGRNETETISEHRDVYRQCFQRELIPPLAVGIGFIEIENRKYYSSPILKMSSHGEEYIKHVANLFLEIFGGFEISNGKEIPKEKIKVLSWKMLPPGEYPFERMADYLKEVAGESSRTYPVIEDRTKFINSFGPKQIYVGVGGFDDYMAYEFDNVVVLESIKIDNALYVFKKDWERVSKLTKKEIIQSRLAHKRIIHKDGWKDSLHAILMKD